MQTGLNNAPLAFGRKIHYTSSDPDFIAPGRYYKPAYHQAHKDYHDHTHDPKTGRQLEYEERTAVRDFFRSLIEAPDVETVEIEPRQ